MSPTSGSRRPKPVSYWKHHQCICLFLYEKSRANLTQTNKKWSLCTHPAEGTGKGTRHSTGRDKHNTNTPHAITCLRVPGLLLMVLVLLSISNIKRGSKPFCQGQQWKKKREERKKWGKEQVWEKAVTTLKEPGCCSSDLHHSLHMLHAVFRSSTEVKKISLCQKQLPKESPTRTLHEPNKDILKEFGY